MKYRISLLFILFSVAAYPQAWSTFLDHSRAIDWTSAGFTIPNFSANCATQPTLTANSLSAAAANTTAIQNALASCDATHNVVNIPAGTYYVAGWTYGTQGKQVVRGADPNSTYVYLTSTVSCTGLNLGICMVSTNPQYNGTSGVLPPSGIYQCAWTGGYTQGSTSITLNNCGGKPPANSTLILDQANDTSDTGGVYICDSATTGCTIEATNSRAGRIIGGVTYSQQQVVHITAVNGSGSGPYTVTISPGVYFNNIRSSQSPGAWWPGMVQNDGLENMTVDHSPTSSNTAIALYNCYQCWIKNVRSIDAGRDHIFMTQSMDDVIRDSYFFNSQSHGSESYGIEIGETSGLLVENNIFQQVTNPLMFAQGSGSVVGYNYALLEGFQNGNGQTSDAGHNAGNGMNLWEGNNFMGIWADIVWGSSSTTTLFRNSLRGWQNGVTQYTYPIVLASWNRAFNAVGNVLGQPGYANTYESYSTSSTGGINGGGTANTSVYTLGWSGNGPPGGCMTPPACDPRVRSTFVRWGNWDVVTAATQWNSTEASPAAVAYVNSNFTSSYFNSLAHTLPASLYYNSQPTWWPSTKAWPPIGPDVSAGNVGTCSSGSMYTGSPATSSNQCVGGSLNAVWASHVTSIPAQDCYLNVMNGPPDGTGGVLSFDAALCYASPGTGTAPASATELTATAR